MPLQSVIMYLVQSEAEIPQQVLPNTSYYIIGREVRIYDNAGQLLATDTTMGLSTIVNVLPSCCAINNTTNIQVIVTSEQSGILTDRNIVVFRLK